MTSEEPKTFLLDASTLDALLLRVLRPECFFVADAYQLRVTVVRSRTEYWEVYNGQLLGPGQTRDEATFDSWRVFLDSSSQRAEQPLLEIKWNLATQQLHVTRALQVHGWETFEPQPNVIESRPAKVWTRELVGTMEADQAEDEQIFAAELALYLQQALTGTSRLAITSLENPLPQFAFGQLAYVSPEGNSSDRVLQYPVDLIAHSTALDAETPVDVHALEVALRASQPQDIPPLAAALAQRLADTTLPSVAYKKLLQNLFNNLGLSPYTLLTDNLVDLLLCLERTEVIGPAKLADTMSYMLRHLVRHLTAFDLAVYHNQGANYPDALFLDRLLHVYVELIRRNSGVFYGKASRLRRRALRQAYWMRRSLEDVCFPDAPTSPGANQRVLPDEYVRVPEQQILDPAARTRKLFEVGSTDALVSGVAREIFEASLADLAHAAELRELGMAVFLDRPLGVFHPPGHPDRTPLVSYEAYSHQIASQRLSDLCDSQSVLDHLPSSEQQGVSLEQIGGQPRPGVVSLADAAQVAEDFVFLRTTRSSLDSLLNTCAFASFSHRKAAETAYAWLCEDPHVLLIRTSDHMLVGYDRNLQKRCVLEPIEPVEYELRWGVEQLRSGVRIDDDV